MRGVLRHYEGRVGRDRINPPPPQPNQLNAQVRWTYLNRGGHHPYVPYVNHQHLNSNRSGFTPWIDAPQRSGPLNRQVTVRVQNQTHAGRPVVRVRPRIRIPDSTTTSAEPTERETTSESDGVDNVEMEGEGTSTDGWEEEAVNPTS